jgi:hypothetical protein
MRTTLLVSALVASLGLSACGGAGRPSAEDVLSRLNSAGVDCDVQEVALALPRGEATEASCLTSDGREIGITTFSSYEKQKQFLETSPLGTSVFHTVVSDFGYLLFVPDAALGKRVGDVMDAQYYTTGSKGCPTARGGVCGTAPAGGPVTLGGAP